MKSAKQIADDIIDQVAESHMVIYIKFDDEQWLDTCTLTNLKIMHAEMCADPEAYGISAKHKAEVINNLETYIFRRQVMEGNT